MRIRIKTVWIKDRKGQVVKLGQEETEAQESQGDSKKTPRYFQ